MSRMLESKCAALDIVAARLDTLGTERDRLQASNERLRRRTNALRQRLRSDEPSEMPIDDSDERVRMRLRELRDENRLLKLQLNGKRTHFHTSTKRSACSSAL